MILLRNSDRFPTRMDATPPRLPPPLLSLLLPPSSNQSVSFCMSSFSFFNVAWRRLLASPSLETGFALAYSLCAQTNICFVPAACAALAWPRLVQVTLHLKPTRRTLNSGVLQYLRGPEIIHTYIENLIISLISNRNDSPNY